MDSGAQSTRLPIGRILADHRRVHFLEHQSPIVMHPTRQFNFIYVRIAYIALITNQLEQRFNLDERREGFSNSRSKLFGSGKPAKRT